MRKPISKNGLRRAFESAMADGQIQITEPVNTVVDRIWHDMEKANYEGPRKRPTARETVRTSPVADVVDLD
jgi:hypothetical protein